MCAVVCSERCCCSVLTAGGSCGGWPGGALQRSGRVIGQRGGQVAKKPASNFGQERTDEDQCDADDNVEGEEEVEENKENGVGGGAPKEGEARMSSSFAVIYLISTDLLPWSG